jgi:membrane protein YdbS with pleckstrin-like domain
MKQSDAVKLSVVPAALGLLFLLAIDVVFLVSIETTISHHDVTEENKWTFGQTLAVLLLALPVRDVVDFVIHGRHEKRRERCNKALEDALNRGEVDEVRKAVRYADIRVQASAGMSPVSLAAAQD